LLACCEILYTNEIPENPNIHEFETDRLLKIGRGMGEGGISLKQALPGILELHNT
jgi:hypothetical protein